ncbi:unnamed protein product [Penicillium pancosmium]
MRRNPYSRSNTIDSSPKRRRIDTGSAGTSRNNRAGVIDQKLIEGSHQPRAYDSRLRNFSIMTSPEIGPCDGDSQLDAFDLDLLASDSGRGPTITSETPPGKATPQQIYKSASLSNQAAPVQTSRFFTPMLKNMPLSGLGSSQPDNRFGPPSSPLALMHQRKNNSTERRGQLEPYREESEFDSTHSSLKQTTSFHPKTRAPIECSEIQGRSPFSNIPLSVRGIVLVPVSNLCEQHRSLFSFPLFNAIQSKCFHTVYNTNDNLVLSAPTGSGKTVIMELAICRLLNILKDERFKVVYQAPTKSLCAERFRDWNRKFSAINLQCAELTGDTDYTQLRSVQNSQIIITTPEKWDSMTRKWKDHMRLMQLVKLFLIDEVHILKESRGATLEAVVSRMKNIGSNVRFVALSATVPNSEDIATWLGKDATTQHVPALREHFGEDFRPVKLQKFVYGYQSSGNDFVFDKICGSKLPDVIGTHSCQKPMMVFCCTRNSSVATAKDLARLWTMTNPPARLWKGPTRHIEVHNEDLKGIVCAGVAFHHAGLGPGDRHAVEKGFLDGHINVICCTSTLAVGVNLPCHLVIIKNTVCWQEGGCQEYSDLEMMQMLGRAGRPQFDDKATAVILTRKERVNRYEKLIAGSESLESCLHLNLIEHLNAEIGLGNVTDLEKATRWLAGTFLFVRLRRNPTYYKLKEGASEEDEGELLRQVCEKDIKLLQECGLVGTDGLHSTQFGEAMARYYIRFETMKILLSLSPKATKSQILGVVVQGEEFHEIRFKAGEKPLYREINKDPGIRFPIKVEVSKSCHKISLLLQAELGAIDFPSGEQFQKHKFSFQQEKSLVLSRVNRLIRCVIDCQISREDSTAILNSLELARSFGANVWDHSPLQMKQIDQVGVVAVRKLAASGIMSLEELEFTEPHQIEMTLSKNPPFGTKLLARVREFPKLRVALKITGREVTTEGVKIRFKLEVAFMNTKIPTFFQRRPIYVCCLTETSDGELIDFRRISASKLQEGLEANLVAELHVPGQFIISHAMCDDIAGTSRQAEIKPEVPSFLSRPKSKCLVPKCLQLPETSISDSIGHPETSQKHHKPKAIHRKDDFEGDDLDLDDFLEAGSFEKKTKQVEKAPSHATDEIEWISIDCTPSPPTHTENASRNNDEEWTTDMGPQEEDYEPVRLANGNWACNHKCKDKTSCKHFCCRDGLEKPPKPGKCKTTANLKAHGLSQLTLPASIGEKKNPKDKMPAKAEQPAKRKTSQLSESGTCFSGLPSRKKTKQTQINYKQGGKGNLPMSKKERPKGPFRVPSSDYGDDGFSDLPSPSTFLDTIDSSLLRPGPPVMGLSQPRDTEQMFIDPSVLNFSDSGVLGKVDTALQLASPAMGGSEARETPPSPSPEQEIIDGWDSTLSESSPEIFTSPAALKSSATTAPLLTSPQNIVRSPKGKERDLEMTHKDLEQPKLDQYPLMDTLHEILSVPAANVRSTGNGDDENSRNGWEDIDRMLYEEYKNIVNFY